MHNTLFKINTISELPQVAKYIANASLQHSIFCFYGEMGAGKTTLIKLITTLLGVNNKVTSPTYSLVNEYSTIHNTTVYHFDFYRINAVSEAYDMGFEEYAYSGNICLIEWPQNITELLPPHLCINIDKTADTSRTISISEVM
ncbi:MAG: tRNA (adenosine(37)-N6)-threonylcarbamoyltransferase complex ATPase subunit type 1 TsaE [Bacteroidia bacterium]|nr:tRNA (adenosine(37)-N6)-threonylcarbamoyltransferase complex ATPase subunit type 1 TsaE [Bacteroidia bacterium]